MPRIQTELEERWNVITHGFGFIITLIGLLWLFAVAQTEKPYVIVSICIYGLCQLFMYGSSTAYHYAKQINLKIALRKCDHIAIYASIAGTYTPMCLLLLIDSNGWLILISVWGIALFGLVWKLFFTGKYESFSSILYLIMGWLIMLDIDSVRTLFSDSMIFWLAAGGVFFTVGIVFYTWNKLYFNHVIWHLFVLAGSASHFIMVAEVVQR
jgi:hemolysin III